MTKKEILLVTNKKELSDTLASLVGEYKVVWAKVGDQVRELFDEDHRSINLIIFDWETPDVDGPKLIGDLHQEEQTPLIALVNSDDVEQVAGNSLINDYIVKPFAPQELSARINVVIRHDIQKKTITDNLYRVRDLTLNIKTSQVFRNGVNIQLTRREFQLLSILFEHQGEPVSRQTLLDQIWGKDYHGKQNIVDVYVRLLRQKIGDQDPTARLIRTVRKVGYIMSAG